MKHHFLLLRHCIRSTSLQIDVGFDDLSSEPADYVGDPLPDWQVPEFWCTEGGLDLTEKSGAWLVDSGIVSSDSHVELISDQTHRDLDTAYSLSNGIQDALDEDSNVSGLDLIRTKSFMFRPDNDGVCTSVEHGNQKVIQDRLDNMRRPDLTFRQALHLLEKIAGTGSVGNLAQYLPLDPTLDYAYWNLTGAANLLMNFAEILFYAKAGLETHDFALKATVEQVYQMLQFNHWFRSVLDIDNNWSGMAGAAWAKVALSVLTKGSLYDAPPQSDSVTIFAGHDTDLHTLSTALGITWDLTEYQTYPEFTPTPPGSGIHLVRDTETDEIQVSFVYPVFHKEGHEHWRTDKSGNMKQVPVIWKDAVSFEVKNQAGPSIQDLESHFVSRLSRYPGAVECYHATAEKLDETLPETATLAAKQSVSGSTTPSAALVVAPTAILFFMTAFFITRRLLRSCNQKEYEYSAGCVDTEKSSEDTTADPTENSSDSDSSSELA